MSVFQRFMADRRGTTGMVLALCAIPVVGLAGAAVDYSSANAARAALQKVADDTALMVVLAKHNGQALDYTTAFNNLVDRSPAASALRSGGALTIGGTWLTPDKEFKVTAAGTMRTSLTAVFQPSVAVSVAAAATGVQEVTQSDISGTNLDPEAADYNELQAYCYNAKTQARLGPIDGTTGQRTAYAKIADNTDAGVKAGPANLNIRCGTDEQVSYLLKNIREARTDLVKQRTATARLFYTDAVKDEKTGVLSYGVTLDGVTRNTLETILCDTQAKCKPQNQGGVLPNNHQTGRTPAVNASVCAPGKFLYFGWEDRIPGYVKNGVADSSDRDFDDIRLVVTCPTTTVGPFRVRLSA
jgi:Flp pilus assembly protein TadG